MRKLRPFEYFRPGSLDEALEIVHRFEGRARILAGGTDLLVRLKRRGPGPDGIVDLKGVPDLDRLTRTERGGYRIGALFTVDAVTRDPDVRARLALLRTAALAIGHPQVRSRATVAGNLCNGSPSADMAPPLLALDAQIHIARRDRTRRVALTDFYAGPFKTVLEPDEIVTSIELPPIADHTAGHYAWMPKVTAVDETLVGAAAVMSIEDGRYVREARIALGSTGPVPMRAWKAERFLEGQPLGSGLFHEAARIAADETRPRRRAEYRREMTRLLLERSLTAALRAAS